MLKAPQKTLCNVNVNATRVVAKNRVNNTLTNLHYVIQCKRFATDFCMLFFYHLNLITFGLRNDNIIRYRSNFYLVAKCQICQLKKKRINYNYKLVSTIFILF